VILGVWFVETVWVGSKATKERVEGVVVLVLVLVLVPGDHRGLLRPLPPLLPPPPPLPPPAPAAAANVGLPLWGVGAPEDKKGLPLWGVCAPVEGVRDA